MTQVILRDLESVLRRQLGEKVIVENFTQKLLLPPGENYGSTMLAVVASIKKNKNSESETLHLVAKMLPSSTFLWEIFSYGMSFRKEIFIYEGILPCYKKLEMEFGVNEEETFDIGARFFGSRLSSKEGVDIDEDAVILLENLKVRGYYTGDRRFGLDLEHARVAIKALAKFHALGMAVKYKHPDQFEALKLHCKALEINQEFSQGMKDSVIKALYSDSDISKYKSKWEPLMELGTENWIGIPEEPWSTIIHTDFWVNNIMFHKNSTGKVDNIKFVDFQGYIFQNPINEIIFFIMADVITDLIPKNLDSFLDLYYETFISVLTKMECDVSLFGRDKFDEKLKKAARSEFNHCAVMLKVVTIDVEKDGVDTSKLQNLEFDTVNEIFFDRMRKLLFLLEEREWLKFESLG